LLGTIRHWEVILLSTYIPVEEEDVSTESPSVLVGVVTGATSRVEC